MKILNLKKFMVFCILNFVVVFGFFVDVNAESMSTGEYDLDFDGNMEFIKLDVSLEEPNIRIPWAMHIQYNQKNDIVPGFHDSVDIPNKDKLAIEKIMVMDINPKDKQKEIVLYLTSTESIYQELLIYSFTNGKINYLGAIKDINVVLGDRPPFGLNKKLNRLEVMKYWFYPFQSSYYEKYIIDKGKLKKISEVDINLSYFDKPISLKAQKRIDVYNSAKFDKKAFVIKPNEKFIVLSANQKNSYIKVKNLSGKVGYVKIVKFDEYDYSLKQYPKTPIEGNDDSPFGGTQHWN